MVAYSITGADGRIITASFANSDSELTGVIKCFLALAADNRNIGEFRCKPVVLEARVGAAVHPGINGACQGSCSEPPAAKRRCVNGIPDIEPEFER